MATARGLLKSDRLELRCAAAEAVIRLAGRPDAEAIAVLEAVLAGDAWESGPDGGPRRTDWGLSGALTVAALGPVIGKPLLPALENGLGPGTLSGRSESLPSWGRLGCRC